MNRFAPWIISIIFLSLSCDGLIAQETRIGNGRLLRKWRDDLFGSDDSKDDKASAKQAQSRQQPSASQPRPPQQGNPQMRAATPQQMRPQPPQTGSANNANNGFRQPPKQPPNQTNQNLTPAQRQQMAERQRAEMERRHQGQPPSRQPQNPLAQRQRSPQNQPQNREDRRGENNLSDDDYDYFRQRGLSAQQVGSQSNQPIQAPRHVGSQPYNRAEQTPSQLSSADPSQQRTDAQSRATKNAKRRGPPVVGFGLELKADKKEGIYIADVVRNGNADLAGIKKGDYVLEIGGAQLASVEEFDEIVKVMNNGDQLQLKISRRGKSADVLLTFGESPDLPEDETAYEDFASQAVSPQMDQSPMAQPRLMNATEAGRFDFVPQPGQAPRYQDGPVVNPGLLDTPRPPVSNPRPALPEIELDLELPALPSRNSVLEID